MKTRPHKNVLASLREHPLRWSIVRDGMQWTAIGLLVIAAGLFLSILSFAVRDWSGVFAAILAVLGGLTLVTGSLLAIIGFVQCLLVPNAAPRILFLSGFLVACYSVYSMSQLFYRFGGGRSGFSDFEDILQLSQMTQIPTTILSLLANLLIVVGFLALAADIGSRKTVKRIRIYWLVQFGGSLLLIGLVVLVAPFVSSFGNRSTMRIIIPLLLGAFALGYTLLLLFMQSSILRGLRTELSALAYQAERATPEADDDEWISV